MASRFSAALLVAGVVCKVSGLTCNRGSPLTYIGDCPGRTDSADTFQVETCDPGETSCYTSTYSVQLPLVSSDCIQEATYGGCADRADYCSWAESTVTSTTNWHGCSECQTDECNPATPFTTTTTSTTTVAATNEQASGSTRVKVQVASVLFTAAAMFLSF
mmetsp:Transcript_74252/g.138691  ORF Transcript_74252/g.138691 Transcript_74252/m.138691 type:complete len:161 (-) Transcript_74252:136-618(-)